MGAFAASYSAGLAVIHLDPVALLGQQTVDYLPFMSGPGPFAVFMLISALLASIPARVVFRCCFCLSPDRFEEIAQQSQSNDDSNHPFQRCVDTLLSPYRFYRRTLGEESDFGVRGKYW